MFNLVKISITRHKKIFNTEELYENMVSAIFALTTESK